MTAALLFLLPWPGSWSCGCTVLDVRVLLLLLPDSTSLQFLPWAQALSPGTLEKQSHALDLVNTAGSIFPTRLVSEGLLPTPHAYSQPEVD